MVHDRKDPQAKVRNSPRDNAPSKQKKMEPMIGIEPMTYSLRVNCSTD